ncbi:MAG: hypothetical protein CMJ72_03385 [Planctomycetaceae bacterium]|nr:hypothetical protein [Planctomycetaceae bacterium]HCK40789.1 hypothetical protein [Planctomycetaceae bacterium]
MSLAKPCTAVETLDEFGLGIRVEFEWVHDRFVHTLIAIQQGKQTRMLESANGNPDNIYPPSPCLTELHQQDTTLFFTGATATCHWSMSVEKCEADSTQKHDLLSPSMRKHSDPCERKAQQGIRFPLQYLSFDIACRVKKWDPVLKPDLGCQYYLVKEFENSLLEKNSEVTIKDLSPYNPVQVHLSSRGFGQPSSCHPEPNCQFSLTQAKKNYLCIEPLRQISDNLPATLQWSYAVWTQISA